VDAKQLRKRLPDDPERRIHIPATSLAEQRQLMTRRHYEVTSSGRPDRDVTLDEVVRQLILMQLEGKLLWGGRALTLPELVCSSNLTRTYTIDLQQHSTPK